MIDHLLVLDIGSSALKAVLFDASGSVVSSSSCPIKTRTADDGTAEQNPDDWWEAACSATLALPRRHAIVAVGLTGTMQNVIALAEDGRALGPAILYSDRRLTDDEVDGLRDRLPCDYAQRTGNAFDSAHSILKLAHLDRYFGNQEDLTKARFLFGAKDVVIQRMTGSWVVDPATATTTGLFKIRNGECDPQLTEIAGVAPEQLPTVFAANTVVGSLCEKSAVAMGLPAGIPVYNGAGDGAAATWGALADDLSRSYVYVGTTSWVAWTSKLTDADPDCGVYTLADPVHADRAIIISPVLNGGSTLEWLANITSVPVDQLALAAESKTSWPLFLPYLAGERAPFEDRQVRGAFLGLQRNHDVGSLCRSVLEGIAFSIRHNTDATGIARAPLTAIGGGMKSRMLLQLIANALGQPLSRPPESQEIPALGVYRMIAPELGFSPIYQHCGAEVVTPEPHETIHTEQRYATYLEASRFARSIAQSLYETQSRNP